MILPCPACQARFMVPDDRITPRGIKIRCPKCRFVFIMKSQKRAVAAAPEASPPTASGTLGQPSRAPRAKTPRKRIPEAEAAKLSAEEIAAMEEEIVDMDELAQATEQSGTAYNPNIKAEHFAPVASSGPSVMIDDSLLTAAAAHSASWTEVPVAADSLPRMSRAAAVTDTWIDIPGRATPAEPPLPAAQGAKASGSLGSASGAIASGSLGSASGAIASGSLGSASGAIASGSLGSASGAVASGSLGSASGATASGALGAPAPPSPPSATPPSVEHRAWPEPSVEPWPELAEAGEEELSSELPDTSDTIPGDVMSPFLMPAAKVPGSAAPPAAVQVPGAAALPVAGQVPGAAALPVAGQVPGAAALPVAGQAAAPRPAVAAGALGSVIPSAPPPTTRRADQEAIELPTEDLEAFEEATPALRAPMARFEMAYTLTAATSFSAAELDELDEYEGLLVEERRALRKGHAATVLLIVGICLGAAILGTLGYLGWQILYPPKKSPPSWGHLELSRDEHSLVRRKDKSPVVVALVSVKNTSSKHKFRNVHILAKVVSPSGQVKCQSRAPCGPKLSSEELGALTEGDYPKALRIKSRVTAYNVQLNPSQEERCQVVLFCGDQYRDEADRVQIEVDKEHSERVVE